MHEAGFGAYGVYPGGGEYARVVQKYAVAFHVSERAVFAYHIRYERLVGIAPRHAAADNFGGAVFAYKLHLETGDCLFAVVGEQFFAHGELAVRVNGGGSEPVRIGNAAQLGALHIKLRVFLYIHLGNGRKFLLAVGVALAVMAFDIFHAAAFFQIEGVDAVVARFAARFVVYAATCDNGYVRALADIKVVIYLVQHFARGQNYGNVHALVLHARFYYYVYAVLVLFGHYLYVGSGVARKAFAVLPYVIRAFRNAVQVGYFHQKIQIKFFHIKLPCVRRTLRFCPADREAFPRAFP